MGRRKGRKEASETLNPKSRENGETQIVSGEIEAAGEGGASGKFFACYLLTSLSPRFKGHTYIGFTVNPRRRIRQHNGEIGSGAWRTKKRRPWEMVFCIYGFPTNVAALQFEWAWQHPVESLAVRKAAATFKSLSGLANKIKLAYTMLTVPSWQRVNLTVNYFSTKYMKHAANCPSLPEHMRVQVGSMDELPCCTGSSLYVGEDDEYDADEDGSADTRNPCNLTVVPSTKDRLPDTQNLSNFVVLQDNSKENDCGQQNWDREIADEQEGSTESTLLREPNNLRIREEEVNGKQSFELDDCSMRTPPFAVSGCNKITRNAEDRGMFRLFDEFIVAYDQLLTKQSPEKVVDNKDESTSTSSEVEVIDVFTPLPCYNTGNKKRRLSVGCPEITDLTNSPMFV